MYVARGSLVSPRGQDTLDVLNTLVGSSSQRSNEPAHSQANATSNASAPLAVKDHKMSKDDSDEYYHYMEKQIKKHKKQLKDNPPSPFGETRVGCRTPVCIGPVDTLVLVDVSGSVGEDDFKRIKDMLQKFPHHFDSSQSLALMSYATYPQILTQWTNSAQSFKSAAMNMELGVGGGDLGGALGRATEVLRYANDRAYHNVLVITDGGTTRKSTAKQMAERLGGSGAQLFMVVVEDFVGPAHDEAFEIIKATDRMIDPNQFMMSVSSYQDLDVDDAIGKMVYMLCPQVANLLSIGSKIERKVVDGNRTAMTQRKNTQRNFRKDHGVSSKHL